MQGRLSAYKMRDVSIDDSRKLKVHIQNRLTAGFRTHGWVGSKENGYNRKSAVLLALTHCTGSNGPCLVLNKRSYKVRQPGDLCYPGGGIRPLDKVLPLLLRIPGLPLSDYAPLHAVKRENPASARRISVLLATSLREAWRRCDSIRCVCVFSVCCPCKSW